MAEDGLYLLAWANQINLKWDDAIKYYQLALTALSVNTKENAIAMTDINKK